MTTNSAGMEPATDRDMPAKIEAFVSDLGISLEPAEHGAWNPYNLRRGDATIPCEAWTRLDSPPAEADVQTAIAWMATVHSTGSPARAERMRAVYLLGQEGYDHLVAVIGPAIARPSASASADTRPDVVTDRAGDGSRPRTFAG